MFLRSFLTTVFLAVVYIAPAYAANSCANLDIMGSYDRSGLQESDYGISSVGTFRIQNEPDENQQPNFNLSKIDCENEIDENGRSTGMKCKVAQAVTWANDKEPNSERPNCSLDLDTSEYSMKQLQKGILVGVDDSTNCFHTMLTVDRNTKRVYLSFTRTKYADNFDKIKPGTCGKLPRTEVLMNCTYWPKTRYKGTTPPRYCDFSSSSDK
jgi:hypothetical protein